MADRDSGHQGLREDGPRTSGSINIIKLARLACSSVGGGPLQGDRWFGKLIRTRPASTGLTGERHTLHAWPGLIVMLLEKMKFSKASVV